MTERSLPAGFRYTEQQLDDAIALLRQASTGTMVHRGRRISPAMHRRATAILAQYEFARARERSES
jgi:citrate lyase beta subunit